MVGVGFVHRLGQAVYIKVIGCTRNCGLFWDLLHGSSCIRKSNPAMYTLPRLQVWQVFLSHLLLFFRLSNHHNLRTVALDVGAIAYLPLAWS